MAKLSRRGFIKQSSVDVATVGVLASVPVWAAATTEVTDTSSELSSSSFAEFAEPLVAHVRDLATGEVALMTGTREIIFRDADLVARLLRAAH